jgi:recombination protein RecT
MSDHLPAIVEGQRQQFLTVCAYKSINFDREAGFALQILRASDYLSKVALNNPASLEAAITNVGAIGISLNPAEKLAYLVPRKVGGNPAVCLDLSYMGLLWIAIDAGAIRWGQAVIVRQKDTFELQGIDKEPKHTYQPFDKERGPIVGVYVVVKTPEGDYLTHPMPIDKVYAIRDRSEAWKAYKRDSSKTCPWVTDEEEMVKKTCVKQAQKYWPKCKRLDEAVHYLNTEGGEGITIKPNTMPEDEKLEWKAKIEKEATTAGAKKVWKEALVVCQGLGDVASAEWLKDVLLKHGESLEKVPA